MRKALGVGVVLVLLLAVTGLASAGENRNYSVHLNGDTEVPANASKAVGQVKLRLSSDGASLDYTAAAVGAPLAWSEGLQGDGIGVAVIDSGIYNHPDLNAANSSKRNWLVVRPISTLAPRN